jgi:16S rRNA (uracil1498-N3)-methyltransferase
MLPRFHVDVSLTVGDTSPLPAEAAHHALRVLRLRDGDSIVLFNGRGGEFQATLKAAGAAAAASIDAFDPIERESPLQLTLLQALVAADKLDWIVEKAVELGVARIVVAPSQRSVVRLDAARAAKKLQHWRSVVRAACCQCGRNRLPMLDYCPTFEAMLAAVPASIQRLVLLPGAAMQLQEATTDGAAVLVGPEGGLTAEEETGATRAGFGTVQLGPRILRTETAGLAALAAMQALGGDLAAHRR